MRPPGRFRRPRGAGPRSKRWNLRTTGVPRGLLAGSLRVLRRRGDDGTVRSAVRRYMYFLQRRCLPRRSLGCRHRLGVRRTRSDLVRPRASARRRGQRWGLHLPRLSLRAWDGARDENQTRPARSTLRTRRDIVAESGVQLREPADVFRKRRSARYHAATGIAGTGAEAGEQAGLFAAAEPAPAAPAARFPQTPPDSLAMPQRLVRIDLGQLTPSASALPSPAGGAPAAAFPSGQHAPGGELKLNLFDDTVFTGIVERTAPTFSGGQSLSGRLVGVEGGTLTLVVNGDVVAGTVRTPEATYRIRPTENGLHAVSQVDLSRLPPLGEPIPRQPPDSDRMPARR